MTNKTIRIIIFLNTLLILTSGCTEKIEYKQQLSTGIYDGKIGTDKIIMVIEESTEERTSGYFLHKRQDAIEEAHMLSFDYNNHKLLVNSDEYNGKFNGDITENSINGELKRSKIKHVLLFWKNSTVFNFIKRTEPTFPIVSRYKDSMFKELSIQKDLVYGNALGYWTETPYLDDPYINILGKGIINFFKAPKMLPLKLDLYQPKNDSLMFRPLVLLIHGGGFYIGNKQSVSEQILANEFAKRGYVVASIDYRMGFKANGISIERGTYRTLQDVDTALRYLSHNANKYRIDPSQVFVAGTSAGAIAALNIAFMTNSERPKRSFKIMNRPDLGLIESSGNNYKERFSIKAVGNMWGAVADTSVIDINEKIPVISFHGTDDNIVPFGHDYPFQNTFMINRLFMNKIYGSKMINQRLTHLNIENKLIPFIGKGHEPQLDNFKTINSLMNTIKNELIDFFFKQMASKIELDNELISIESEAKVKALEFSIVNGEVAYLDVKGGFKISADPNETKIIWVKEYPHPTVTIYAKNKFDAWSEKTINVKIIH